MDNKTIPKGKYDRSKLATVYGYENNKDVIFKYITGIHIDRFRSLSNRDIKLGKYLNYLLVKTEL